MESLVIERIAGEADGLSGAHLREVCYAAALAVADNPKHYSHALGEQLRRVQDQHRNCRKYGAAIRPVVRLGFGIV